MRKTFGFLLIAAGIFGLCWALTGGTFFDPFGWWGDRSVHAEKTIDAGEIDELLVITRSADATFVKGGDAGRIRATLEGKSGFLFGGKAELETRRNGDALELSVHVPNRFPGFGFKPGNLKLRVELPEKIWRSFAVETGSGDVQAEEIAADDATIRTGSGDVSGSGIAADALAVTTGSGDIGLERLNGGTFNVKTGSGDVKLERFEAETLAIVTGSGDVSLIDGQAELRGKTGSGDVRIAADRLLHDADLESGSGDVTVKLAERPESLTVDYRARSGRAHIGWDGLSHVESSKNGRTLKGTFGAGETLLRVRSGSGDLTLN